jgi:PAS domain S-box-containing protein
MKKRSPPSRKQSSPARKNPPPRVQPARRTPALPQSDLSPFFDSPLDLLCIGDSQAIFRKLNPQWEAILGYSQAEMEGKDFIEFIHPEDKPAALEAFRKIGRHKSVQTLTNRIRSKDGTYRWLEWKYILRGQQIFAAARDITDRKQAEDALRQSEERYRRIIRTITDYIYHVRVENGKAVETFHSRRCLAVTGYSAEEIAKDPDLWLRMVDPEDRPMAEEQARIVLSGMEAPVIEHRLWRKDGIQRWVRNTPVLHHDKEGKLLSYDGLIQDITERKEAELQIREQHDLALALNVTTNMDEGLNLCLQTAIRVSGMDHGGIYLRDPNTGALDQIVHHGLTPDFLAKVKHLGPDDIQTRSMMEGQPIYSNYESLRELNLPLLQFERFHALAGIPIRYENQIIGFLTLASSSIDQISPAVRDTLETTVAQFGNAIIRLRTEAALRESRRMLEMVLDTIPVRVFWKDRDSRYLGCNRSFAQDAGFSSPTELIGRDDYQMGWVEQAAMYRFDDQAVMETGCGKLGYEEPQTQSDGKRIWLRTSKVPLRDPDGKIRGVLGTYEDITDKKLAEEEIRALNAELERRVSLRTAQLEATNKELEAFSYSVSHDLRAPLRAIDGFTRALEEDYGKTLDEEGKRLCAVVRRNTRQMNELIDNLLDLSRFSRTEMEYLPADMDAMVRSVFQELIPAGSRARIDFHLEPLPTVTGDPILLRQVWINLIANAIKFSAKRDPARIEVEYRSSPEEDIFTIRDNGAGFDMQYADRLFSVFQRLHSPSEFEGTGVGLAIVQRVIHRHGGRVWAEGAVEKGAEFHFSLPKNKPERSSPTP